MLFSNTKAAALVAISTAVSLVNGLGQQPIISFTNTTENSFQIAGGSITKGQILISSNDYWGVIRAAGDLAMDFGRVTGTNYTLSNGQSGASPAAYVYQPVNNMNNTVVCFCLWTDARLRHPWLTCISTPQQALLAFPALHMLMLRRKTSLSLLARLATRPSSTI